MGSRRVTSGTQNTHQALIGELIPADKGPSGKKLRRFRLTTARGVRRELAALYAELRNGRVDEETARAGGFLLRCVLESLRLDEIEQRLTALEQHK